MKKNRAVFLDLNGTLVLPLKQESLGLDLKGPYVCPHRYNHPCPCEKPNTFLYDQAAQELSLDLSQSYTIGDSPQDCEAARRFGGTGCLVRTGWAVQDRFVEEDRPFAAFIGDTIAEVVDWILNREIKYCSAERTSHHE